MAEIKSTLELAMERTKKMAISKEEREEIKGKEFSQKATRLFHRYKEGHLPLNEILREIERMDDKTRTWIKENLLSQWIEALSLNEDNERILKGIQSLKERDIDDIRQKIHDLLSQYQGEKKNVKEKVMVQFTEALKKDGIYGSAVEPNLETAPIFKEALHDLAQSYSARLKPIKEQLRNL
jgi:hypothetical protein